MRNFGEKGAGESTTEAAQTLNIRDERKDSFENKLRLGSRQRLLRELPNLGWCGVTESAALKEFQDSVKTGTNHLYQQHLAEKFSAHSIGLGFSNFALINAHFPLKQKPFVDIHVVLGNYQDAKRIAETHVKKGAFYGSSFLGDGVLSATDNDLWTEQRKHLSDAFLPQTNLKRVFPISLSRAKYAVESILPDLIRTQENAQEGVEINEFLLYEAMAQLQLALFGESEANMDKLNLHMRQTMEKYTFPEKKDENGDFVFDQSFEEAVERRREATSSMIQFANEMLNRGAENVQKQEAGPVMESILSMCPFGRENHQIQKDTFYTFLFAGHDTTANLMTHFLYEMAENPTWQAKVQKEVDLMFQRASSEKREINYEDLKTLLHMKRCINETLRLWPSVPSGTFREFEFDDFIQGKDGKQIKVDKGMQVTIPVWLLHRNPVLWGDDVNKFNPDREWLPEEDWNGQGLLGFNPQSHRFCPFTFGPRDCMGKNFAQMEARIILSCILKDYNVSLGAKTKGKSIMEISVNRGTLGAKKGLYLVLTKRSANI